MSLAEGEYQLLVGGCNLCLDAGRESGKLTIERRNALQPPSQVFIARHVRGSFYAFTNKSTGQGLVIKDSGCVTEEYGVLTSFDDEQFLCRMESLEQDSDSFEVLSLFFPAKLCATISTGGAVYMDGRVGSPGGAVRTLQPNMTQLLATAPGVLLFGKQLEALNMSGHSMTIDQSWSRSKVAVDAIDTHGAIYLFTRTSGVFGSDGDLWILTARESRMLRTSSKDRAWGDVTHAGVVNGCLLALDGESLMCIADVPDSTQSSPPELRTSELMFTRDGGQSYEWSDVVATCSDGSYMYIAQSTSTFGDGGVIWRVAPGAQDREVLSEGDWGAVKVTALC